MKKLLIILCLMASFAAPGCSFSVGPTGSEETAMAGAPYHEAAMQNLILGRRYMSQGRYELARERFMLGLAAARNEEMRQTLAQDLNAADLMVRSQR